MRVVRQISSNQNILKSASYEIQQVEAIRTLRVPNPIKRRTYFCSVAPSVIPAARRDISLWKYDLT